MVCFNSSSAGCGTLICFLVVETRVSLEHIRFVGGSKSDTEGIFLFSASTELRQDISFGGRSNDGVRMPEPRRDDAPATGGVKGI